MKDFKQFIVYSLIIFFLWLLSIRLLPYFIESSEERGQFGDSFGALNSLFSGLAFAGIIATIIMQRAELKLQRDELRLTREELKKSASAQEASHKALNLQVVLMSKQALINAYQTTFSNNMLVINSGLSEISDINEAKRSNIFLQEEITRLTSEIEFLND